MGDSIEKPKSRLKELFNTSKKLIQPPKELPEIGAMQKTPPLEIPFLSQLQKKTAPPILQKEPVLPPQPPRKDLRLPKIEAPALALKEKVPLAQQQPIKAHEEDLKRFEEAISNINIDMIHSESPSEPAEESEESENKEYYKPKEMGEGYFSEIEHYIKNKDVNEIIDDILKKDFLGSMKDYHENKMQGKPFYLHEQDLKNKLRNQMDKLQRLEEEWHKAKTRIDEEERRKTMLEQEIDLQSQDLKDIFKQIKISQWMEQEAPKDSYFKLRNGQELKSLNDLRKALSYMTEEDFSHHVNQEKNDFATWVRETLHNLELHEKIRNAKTRQELEAVLKNPL